MGTQDQTVVVHEHRQVTVDPALTIPEQVSNESDPVVSLLRQTEQAYRAARERQKREAEEVEGRLQQELQLVQRLLEAERARTARQRERADRLAAALKDIHRALFGGNVFDLILRACVTITGATRGVYLTAWGNDRFRARAAVDMDGYPKKEPSPFLRALGQRVVNEQESFVCNDARELSKFPPPDSSEEAFHNCLVAPAVLLKEFNGVVILADKPGDGFDEDDIETVMSVGDQAAVALENRQLRDELLRAYFSVVGVLADAIEAKDPYTKGHCEDVARYSRLTAMKLSESDEMHSISCYGGLLHDIGKIGVSDGVLNKPGKLLPEEWNLMRSHVRIGKDLLARIPALDGVADIVFHHHERYDGQGYPDGLKAEQISLAARIVCVVDSYCAMIAKRSYKDSATAAEAREELIRCKGTHFDPQVVDAFLSVLDHPEAVDPCPDGCDLLPNLNSVTPFQHAIRKKS